METKTLFIEFDYGFESFSVGDDAIKQAYYWIGRRIEKTGSYAKQAFIVNAKDILNVEEIIRDIEKQNARYEKRQQEAAERELLKKLKAKYERKATPPASIQELRIKHGLSNEGRSTNRDEINSCCRVDSDSTPPASEEG